MSPPRPLSCVLVAAGAGVLLLGERAHQTHLSSVQTAGSMASSAFSSRPGPIRASDAGVASAFVENLGQWRHGAHYVARFGGTTAFLEDDGWTLRFDEPGRCDATPTPRRAAGEPRVRSRSAGLRMRFVGARTPRLVAGPPLAGVHAYFLGNDPGRWRTAVPRHADVTYRGLYPGVDVRVYDREGRFEYDVVLAPGADLAQVEIEIEGARGLSVDGDGTLLLDTEVGVVRQLAACAHEVDVDGGRRELVARHELRGRDRIGFSVPDWSGAGELVLDPGIVWSTFVGGSNHEGASSASVDASGVVTITGYTFSPGYPTTPGAYDATHNNAGLNIPDVFVTRLDPSRPPGQQLLFSTFVGGSIEDYGYALAVDAAGVVTLAGWTTSPDYPTTDGSSLHGGYDVIVTRLDPSRSGAAQLAYSGYLGGSAHDQAFGVAVDAAGVVTLTGMTESADYPTTPGAFDTTLDGVRDVFVTRLDPALAPPGHLVYSTLVGGSFGDAAQALALSPAGVVTLVGDTNSPDFPTTAAAFDRSYNFNGDAFVLKLDPSLPTAQQVVASTFVGGVDADRAWTLAVDQAGAVTFAGDSPSLNYPVTPDAWDQTQNGGYDRVVTRLDASLSTLLYSTFLGGSDHDRFARAIAVDSAGIVTVGGATMSADFPTTPGAWDRTHNSIPNEPDVTITRLDPSRPAAEQLIYSTFLGGVDLEYVWGVALDAAGGATVAGSTYSVNFPTTSNAHNSAPNGGQDVFVTRLDMLPTGVSLHGDASPGCAGPPIAAVTSMPRVGNQRFALTCTGAPPNGIGVTALASGRLPAPIAVFGARLWLDPFSGLFLLLDARADARGAAGTLLPIPADGNLAGARVHAQFFWFGPTAPPPCPPLGWSASMALEVAVQP